ncbi:Oxidoreductase FAD/NAD(P)-binding protein [Macrophomina phaseolina MS6]|uniref:Oxidoreductase FAD/NAD(P)-binding protein n=1 Tax=Macrophomina phaseolina (strain MS6) TaxID=1126212 RepID=K2RNV8_MACPH|nr:Oxidoreductase FAD/NAD(P)-binding protein [Macrophomina phaseolina MS6]
MALRPIRANLGAVAAAGIGAGLLYTYFKPKSPTVFGSFNPQYLRLESVDEVNHNTKRLRFAFPHPDDLSGLPLTSSVLTFSWPAGRLTPVARPYTPITPATTPGHLDLLVKRYPDGKQSTHLHSLAPGDSLAFVAALPGFRWTPNAFRHVACIAGGAGITPIYQLVHGILANPEDRTTVSVVYGANSDADVLLKDELDELAQRFPGRLAVTYTIP